MQATGRILAYLNSDDCYLEDAIGIAARGFLGQPQAGMVYGTAIIVNGAGEAQRMWRARPFDLKTMLLVDNVVPQPGAFFSAEVLKYVGYLVEQLRMIMDYELCIRIGMRYPSVCLPVTLAQFRDHLHSKTRTQSEVAARELIQFAHAFFAQESSMSEVQSIRGATLSRYHYMLALGYIAAGRPHAAQSLQPLLRSLQFHLPFVLKRPVQTAYVVKEILLGYLARVQYRFNY
jgi:hypothetical protein